VLQALRQKRLLEEAGGKTSSIRGSSNSAASGVLKKMQEYLSKQPDYMAKSADILTHCEVRLDGVQEVANIRQLLKQIAVWQRSSSMWQLKDEFR
jgi:lysophospholipid acyltransferase (LPLAT)-like uncharacterized protein